ncbi:MAG: YihY/virulence factor BrkB family protein [Flavobacterium sp.]|nr:MAG: YihY/virulence factor BrkB family protein [Flavobacterium sp.]
MKKLSRDIRNIEELAAQQSLLKKEIGAGEKRIRESIEGTAWLIPAKITEDLTKTPFERNVESLSDPIGKLLPELSSLLIKKIIPRKVGIFNRIMLTSAAKMLVKKVLKPFAARNETLNEHTRRFAVTEPKVLEQVTNTNSKKNDPAPTTQEKKKISLKGLWHAFIIGLITLLIGATTVFGDIQDSINTIWGIKPKPKRGWLKMLQNRFLSFSVIVSLGFLLLVSLGVTAILDGFSNRLQARFADVSVILFYILNTIITLGVVSAIFGVIFKVLPDANIKWRDVAAGALVTGVLFLIGKMGISLYISKSDVGSTYGAAGSLVILLLWTYYSSIILYFGAEFTKSYAVAYGSEILPNHYAVTIKEIEVEQGSKSVQDTHAENDNQ